MEKNKENVAIKLTKKNVGKVFDLLKMFGEGMSMGLWDVLKGEEDYSFEYSYFETSVGRWWGADNLEPRYFEVVKFKEFRNILAKEHLKKGDVVVYKVSYKWCGIVDRIEGDKIYLSKAVCLNGNTIYEGGFEPLSTFNFLHFATDEEKALLEPKPVETEVQKEVYVVVCEDRVEATTEENAAYNLRINYGGTVVKGTLTYKI